MAEETASAHSGDDQATATRFPPSLISSSEGD